MPDHDQPMCLISIQPEPGQLLFRNYRDFLVYLSLTRDLALAEGYDLFGFSWLSQHVYLLCCSEHEYQVDPILSMMKRYYYWLQVAGPCVPQFKLQMITLTDDHEAKEALKFVHMQVTTQTSISDPLAYHWHSFPVYHDYWQLNWLQTQPMLALYSSNPVLAMNKFRDHMLLNNLPDFQQRLDTANEASLHISPQLLDGKTSHHQVASPISQYHQCLNNQVRLEVSVQTSAVVARIIFPDN